MLFSVILAGCGGESQATPTADPQVLINEGRSALKAGDTQTAIAKLEAATKADPSSAEAFFLLGNAYYKTNPAKAIEAYKKALEISPDNSDYLTNLGVAYYLAGNLDDSERTLRKAVEQSPDDATANYLLGVTLLQKGRLDDALSQFEKANSLNPNMPEPYYGLGMVYKLKGEKDEAIDAFKHFLKIGPGQDPRAMDEAKKQLQELGAK
jgi:Flp pilus assembly protein TadD